MDYDGLAIIGAEIFCQCLRFLRFLFARFFASICSLRVICTRVIEGVQNYIVVHIHSFIACTW